jgi:hypothetical protein
MMAEKKRTARGLTPQNAIVVEDRKAALIQQAKDKYRDIFPTGRMETLDDCFTVRGDELIFWFNTSEGTTHVLKEKLE